MNTRLAEFRATVHDQGSDDEPTRKKTTALFRQHDRVLLVATDAASEGLNLHERCHHLIHLELPWNPNRLEQRNGRIDRYGQWRAPVIRSRFRASSQPGRSTRPRAQASGRMRSKP